MHQSSTSIQIFCLQYGDYLFRVRGLQLLLGRYIRQRHQSGCPTNHVLARQGHFVEQRDARSVLSSKRRKVLFSGRIRRTYLLAEDAPARSNSKQPSKNTDSAFLHQVAAAAPCRHKLVYTAAITRL